MIVILEKDHQGLGQIGDVKEVKRGYAMNFLLPQGIAAPATESRVLKLAKQLEAQKSIEEKLAADADKLQKEFEGKTFEIQKKVTKAGKLYGSVTEKDVVDVIKADTKKELTVNNVKMDHLKEIGSHTVTLKLSSEVSCEITVNITAS